MYGNMQGVKFIKILPEVHVTIYGSVCPKHTVSLFSLMSSIESIECAESVKDYSGLIFVDLGGEWDLLCSCSAGVPPFWS